MASKNSRGTQAVADGNLLALVYEGQRLRFVGTADKPEWVAQDVCDILDIENARQAIAGFDADEKGVCTTYTIRGKQTLITVYVKLRHYQKETLIDNRRRRA